MTLPAIIDLSRAVVCVEESDSLESEYVKLMVEQGLLTERLAKQASRYVEINDTLSRKNPTIVADCNSLQGEISILEEELQDLLGVGDTDEDLEDEMDAAIEKAEAEEERESNRAMRSRAKYLFNKIASVCHPDKARNSNLVEIFYMAEAAKRVLDLTTLERLYDQVLKSKSKSKFARSEAKAQLELLVLELKQSVSNLKTTYQHNTTVGLNPIFERYEVSKSEGEMAFVEVMRRTIVRLNAHKVNMQASIAQAKADAAGKNYEPCDTDYSGTPENFDFEGFEDDGDEDFDDTFKTEGSGALDRLKRLFKGI